MDESSEQLSPTFSTLSVEYRGQNHRIPIAKDKKELKKLIREIVLPSLGRIKGLNNEVELAITEYVYSKDESLETTEKGLKSMLKDADFDTNDINYLTRISRREGLNPVFSNQIKWRRDFPKDAVDDEILPFARRTFLIAPMVVNKEIFENTKGPSLEEDFAASNFFVGNAVAFDGSILIDKAEKEYKQMTNQELLELISPLIEKE